MGAACGTVEVNGKYMFNLLCNREGKPRFREAGTVSRISPKILDRTVYVPTFLSKRLSFSTY